MEIKSKITANHYTKFVTNLAIKTYLNILLFGIAVVAVTTLTSCGNEAKTNSYPEAIKLNQDSIDEVRSRVIPPIDTFPEIRYNLVKFQSSAQRNRFFDSLSRVPEFNEYALMMLNRKEYRFLRGSEEILFPEVFYKDSRAYSIFPPYYAGAKDIHKIILISAHYQQLACYEWGVLVKSHPVNSGKEKTPSYKGRYALTFRQLERKSSIDSTWIMKYYFNFHPEAGMALHQFVMPGFPASHSCMRQFLEDAMWIYKWGKGEKLDSNNKRIPLSGTPVIILDHYPFGIEYRPWMQISGNRSINFQLPEKPMEVDEPLIPIIQIPQEIRGILRNRERFVYAEDSLRKMGIIREGVELIPSINYNKLRRIKAAKEAEEKRKQELLKQNQINTEETLNN